MAVTYELLETFNGTRVETTPDPDNEGETIESTVTGITDIKVKFTSDHTDPASIHERTVNVCFDGSGNYDDTATKARCVEVANGVENKYAVGVISQGDKSWQ